MAPSWLWLRLGHPWWVGLIGALVLVLYGVLPTLQPQSFDFARTCTAYGGLLIVFSLLWGHLVEGRAPAPPSLYGAALALLGALVIASWPRT